MNNRFLQVADSSEKAKKDHGTKCLLIATGLKLGVFAYKAGISPNNLSQHLSGSRRNHKTQLKIWDAYRVLTGSKISLEDFWGSKLSQRLESHDKPEHRKCTTTQQRARRA